jgi:hypothetical protein
VAHLAVTLLIDRATLDARRAVAAGPLAPLSASLRADLDRLLRDGFHVPREKALLSRDGGRCERDGMLLRFDPFSPREHACPNCGAIYRRDRDYLWWVTSYQLWLAERAVYAATLHALAGEPALAAMAERILEAYAAQYLQYPNRDNALGPTRPFFSTYLESIWLLQLAVALSLLESSGGARGLGARVREQVIEPSARLIASFDEGDSNRQVWNAAALLAAGRVLGDPALVDHAILGPSGLIAQLARGLLPDGSWYEGENYHVFAHRGLWYAVTMSEQAGCPPPNELVRRFEEGFALPLLTALPDLTIPSRRDSQYAISLRQWRFAESFELGLARGDDPRLAAALGRLYTDAAPRRDTGRWRSAADTQPHEQPSSLTRADLGWRALLFARAILPDAPPSTARSTLLDEQGLALFRRNGGRTYVALDYGHSGGGHGHPDRLNLLFARGDDRILDDYGTGSYVDSSLHWYRSTLAHNAPLFDGVSQLRTSGRLLAHEERGAAGWVDAEVPLNGLAPGVRTRRSLVVLTDYFVDRLEWESTHPVRAELPIHVPADTSSLEFHHATLDGGGAPEDGFSFVRESERAIVREGMVVPLRPRDAQDIEGWVAPSARAEWWRALAPGPPGAPERPLSLMRVSASAGSITSVWSWGGAVTGVTVRDGALIVRRGDHERHEHVRREHGWSVTLHSGSARSSIELGGQRRTGTAVPPTVPNAYRVTARQPLRVRSGHMPLGFALGEKAYRRSEESWEEVGRPRAEVALSATRHTLVIEVSVTKPEVVLRAPDAADPALDNEHADIHSDGAQLYVVTPGWDRPAAWLVVPEHPAPRVRTRVVDGARRDVPLVAGWSSEPTGYAMRFEIPLDALGTGRELPVTMDLIINEMATGRVRRRGQLVLSGGGGWIYLQGDRQSVARFLPVVIERD